MLELLPVVRLGRTNPRAFRLSSLAMASGSYPMEFGNVDKGQLITLLVEPLIFDPSHDAHQVKVVHSGALCYFSGLLPAGFMRFTLCDVEVVRQFPCPLVKTSAKTRVLSHSPPSCKQLGLLLRLQLIPMC